MYPLGSDTVAVINRTPRVDSGGRPVVDSGGRQLVDDDAPITVENAAVDVLSSSETNSNVNPSTLVIRAFLPPETPISVTSAITWRGMTFEVHGPPQPWTDHLDHVGHIEATARMERG